MLLSYFFSAICYAMTALSSSLLMLYLSRIPSIFQHAIICVRTLVSVKTNEKFRVYYLSYIGVAYGLGYAIGPILGGYVGENYSL